VQAPDVGVARQQFQRIVEPGSGLEEQTEIAAG
jgi:hypothetical protein